MSGYVCVCVYACMCVCLGGCYSKYVWEGKWALTPPSNPGPIKARISNYATKTWQTGAPICATGSPSLSLTHTHTRTHIEERNKEISRQSCTIKIISHKDEYLFTAAHLPHLSLRNTLMWFLSSDSLNSLYFIDSLALTLTAALFILLVWSSQGKNHFFPINFKMCPCTLWI